MNWKKIIKQIKTLEDLKRFKNRFYNPAGELRKLENSLRATSELTERKKIGKSIQKLKKTAQSAFKEAARNIEQTRIKSQVATTNVDLTLPNPPLGSLHPITHVTKLIETWLVAHGYFCELTSEVESDNFNFDYLNIQKDHPSRTEHDSFYVGEHHLLRTHNTSVTARLIAKSNHNWPFAAYTIGKVYRNDNEDATHSHQFTQCDFFLVGPVSFGNLKWTLKSLISYVLGPKTLFRFRPSYFPFTEPSLEMDVFYGGKWVEILGAGMINQNVFKIAKVKKPLRGFAAGLGVERLVMIKYNIIDVRSLYQNDLRFLRQFSGVV